MSFRLTIFAVFLGVASALLVVGIVGSIQPAHAWEQGGAVSLGGGMTLEYDAALDAVCVRHDGVTMSYFPSDGPACFSSGISAVGFDFDDGHKTFIDVTTASGTPGSGDYFIRCSAGTYINGSHLIRGSTGRFPVGIFGSNTGDPVPCPAGISATGFDFGAGGAGNPKKFIDISGATNIANADAYDSYFYVSSPMQWEGDGVHRTSIHRSATEVRTPMIADISGDDAISLGTSAYTTFTHAITLPDEAPVVPAAGKVRLGWDDTNRDLEMMDDGGVVQNVATY